MNEIVPIVQGFCVLFTGMQVDVHVHYNSECIQRNKSPSINGGNLTQCSPHTSKSSTERNIINLVSFSWQFLSTHWRNNAIFFGDYISKTLASGSFTRRPEKVRLDLLGPWNKPLPSLPVSISENLPSSTYFIQSFILLPEHYM